MALDPTYSQPRPGTVFFERGELNQILRVYGRMVAAGEWRDYGIAGGAEAAVFSIFRRTAEAPLYRIEKRPALARRQGAWAVLNAAGLSFIGLGVRPPTAEWGIMVAEGAQFIISGEWWVALFPGLALMLAVFCFNLLGDGLRDLIDPRRRT